MLDSRQPFLLWNILTDDWFKGENIPGSRRVPPDKVGQGVRSTNLPWNSEIVVYCGGQKCPQSRMAAEKLTKLGYENVGLAVEKAHCNGLIRTGRGDPLNVFRSWPLYETPERFWRTL